MVDIDEEDFGEIYQFHRETYEASPRYDTLREYVEDAYPILEQVTARHELIGYGELREQLGTHRGYLASILGTISHLEMRHGRPPLSIVVVRKGSTQPSKDFLNLFTELNAEHPYSGLPEEDAIERILEDAYEQHS